MKDSLREEIERKGADPTKSAQIYSLISKFCDEHTTSLHLATNLANQVEILRIFTEGINEAKKFERLYKVTSDDGSIVPVSKETTGKYRAIHNNTILGKELGTLQNIPALQIDRTSQLIEKEISTATKTSNKTAKSTSYIEGYGKRIVLLPSTTPNNPFGNIFDKLEAIPLYLLTEDKLDKVMDKISKDNESYMLPKNMDSKVKQKLLSLDIDFSNSINSHISFTSLSWASKLIASKKHLVKVIKLDTEAKDFQIVSISIKEYLANQKDYIALIEIPKFITLAIKTQEPYFQYLRFVAPIRTLVIPQEIMSSTDEVMVDLLVEFLEGVIQKNMDSILDKAAYNALLNELPDITEYWDGFIKILGRTDANTIKNTLKEIDNLRITPKIDDKLKGVNGLINKLFSSKETLSLLKDSKEVDEANTKLANLMNSIRQMVRERSVSNDKIYKLSDELEELKESVEELSISINNSVTNRDELQVSLRDSIDKLKTLRDDFEHKFEDLVREEYPNYENPIYITRIVFNSIRYGDFVLDLKDPLNDSEINSLRMNLLENDTYLINIRAVTRKPVKIYVDAFDKKKEDCDVVVGGPYSIDIKFNPTKKEVNGFVRLSDNGAVFGIEPLNDVALELKQHPHSTPMRVMRGDPKTFKAFIAAPTKICFGEAQSQITKAFEDKNIEMIRLIIGNWISNCYSKDQWGKQWQWFPHPNKISNI